jgi:predicted dehydrogenase
MKQKPVRWGIMGTAGIARKSWKGIQLTGNSIITAVASRDHQRSDQFITECQAEAPMPATPQAFGSYEELLASPEVDAVYMPLPTGIRKEWVLRSARAGKHVLSEKPCAVSVADLQQMLDACRKAGVQFMDNVMFVHSPRFKRICELLQTQESIGQLKRMTSAFTFLGDAGFFTNNIRVDSRLEPLGCLGDLGWYCIRFFLSVMNWRMPIEVRAWNLFEAGGGESPGPVPVEFSGEMLFEGGVSASFYCSFVADTQQWAIVSGTSGILQVSDFVLPSAGEELAYIVRKHNFRKQGCDFRMEMSEQIALTQEASHGAPTAQEVNCFRSFADQIRSGELNEEWHEAALKTQTLANACLDAADRTK